MHEPRVEKLVCFLAYLGIGVLSLLTMFSPPMTVSVPLGPVLTYVWLGLWVTSAVGCGAVVLAGWWKAERVFLAVGLLGIGIYSAVVVTLHVVESGSRLAQLTVIWTSAAFYVYRMVRIWGADFEPRA